MKLVDVKHLPHKVFFLDTITEGLPNKTKEAPSPHEVRRGPLLVHFLSIFPNFGGKKLFKKIRLFHTELHMSFYHGAKIQKKLCYNSKKNYVRVKGWEDPIL